MTQTNRTCQVCGRALQPQARFCPQCGAQWQDESGPLTPGALLKGADYRIVRAMTKGGMGAVYLAEDRRAFDRPCVIKQMIEYYDPADPEEAARAARRFEEEGRTLAALSHPGAPQIYAFFQENGRYYIVMEYVRGEDLESFVTHEDDHGQLVRTAALPREEIIRYVIQVCDILEYLHSQSRPVVHQDIKPGNLILDRPRGTVRLVDFGTAYTQPRRVRSTARKAPKATNQPPPVVAPAKQEAWGTDGYAPPEQYRGEAVPASDVFALAATAYHLLTDDDPRQHPFKFPRLNELPKDLAGALQRALRTDPGHRPTAGELRQALEALSAPQRTLESFAFPGGTQIRSIAALPALCDEHWDAARSFLYQGDFQRWLRDLNRHDLVIAADDIVKHQGNRDAGLETFLHIIDPGLPHPKLVSDPELVDLGRIARTVGLRRRVTLLNTRRGYTQVRVSASQPWVEVFPEVVNLWSGIPSDVRLEVRADGLPLRSQQKAFVSVRPIDATGDTQPSAPGRTPVAELTIPVTARVSLWREAVRLTLRALWAAIPLAWRTASRGWQSVGHLSQRLARPFRRYRWLLWLVWAALSVGVVVGLHSLPADFSLQLGPSTLLNAPVAWSDYVLPAVLGPPVFVSVLWLLYIAVVVVGGAILGALQGAIRSFTR